MIRLIFLGILSSFLLSCTCDDKWAEPLHGPQSVRKMGERAYGSSINGSFFFGTGSISGGGSEPAISFFWEIGQDTFVSSTVPLSKTTVKLVKGKKIPSITFIFYNVCTSDGRYKNLSKNIKQVKITGLLFSNFQHQIKNLIIETDPEHWPVQINLPMNKETRN